MRHDGEDSNEREPRLVDTPRSEISEKPIVGLALAGAGMDAWMTRAHHTRGGALYSGARGNTTPLPFEPLPQHGHTRHFPTTLERWFVTCRERGLCGSRVRPLAMEGKAEKLWIGCHLGMDINSPAQFDCTFQMTLLAPCRILHALCCQRTHGSFPKQNVLSITPSHPSLAADASRGCEWSRWF